MYGISSWMIAAPIGSVVGRVDLIRVAQRAGAVEMDEDHRRRVVGHPGALEIRAGGHHRQDVGKPGAVTADVDSDRVAPVRLAGEIAGQDHSGAKVDRPAVEIAEPL